MSKMRSQIPLPPEHEEIVRAIRAGEVDAFVIEGPGGEIVRTLAGGEPPYRAMIERLREGAVILATDGAILYHNEAFARMVSPGSEAILGRSIVDFTSDGSRERLLQLLASSSGGRCELLLSSRMGETIPVSATASLVEMDGVPVFSVVVADLRPGLRLQELEDLQEELRRQNEQLAELQAIASRDRERYEGLFQFAPDPYLVTDLAGRVTEANVAALRVLSADPDTLLGSHLRDAVAEPYRAMFDELLAGTNRGPLVLEMDPAGRPPFITEAVTVWARGEAGGAIGVRWALRDVTDREHARRTIARRNHELELLTRIASELLQSDEPQHAIERRCHEVMSFLDCQVLLHHLFDPEGGQLRLKASAGLDAELEREFALCDTSGTFCGCVSQTCQPIVAENVQGSSDPRTRLVRSCGLRAYACFPLLDGAVTIGTLSFGTRTRDRFCPEDVAFMGAVAHHVAIATGRLKAQQKEAAYSQLLSVALRGAQAGAWEWDLQRGQILWSPEYRELYGFDPTREPSYEGWLDAVLPEDRERADSECRGALMSERPELRLEFRVSHPTKGPRWFESVGRVSRTADGKPAGMVGITFDITERKKLELDLARQAAELERKNSELARCNEELEKFSHFASHDLRSPLLSINGCLQLLEEEYGRRLKGDALELMRHARQAITHMSALLKGLLDYSRVGATPKRSLCRLEKIFATMQAALEERIRTSGAQITHDPLPEAVVDENQMGQLFQNLVENALKYCGSEGPVVHIGVKDAGSEWVFSVRDNGIGIDPQHFDRVFQIFQRLHANDQRYPGTGLGLSICKKIVESHGGRIWVESQPGQGSTFFFTLPK